MRARGVRDWARTRLRPDETGAAETAAGPRLTRGPGARTADAAETGRPPPGEPRVDAALRLLDRLPGLPVSEHPELFEQVHAQLSEVLGELDSGAAGPAASQAADRSDAAS